MTAKTFEQVRGIASDLFAIPPDRITAASAPENIESWDSTQHLNFVLALEEKFGFQLSPEEMEQMRNIGEIVKLIDSRLQTTAP
ncbi:MAG TPA: acyl carrier protein [Terriglobales bacterium]|nr:acyl carrier protein [Terriglobales bacterium]